MTTRSISLLCLAGVLACGPGGPQARPAPGLANHAGSEDFRPLFMVTEAGIGPIRAGVQVTEEALRPLLPGYDVKAEPGWDLDEMAVYKNGDRLFHVVPDGDGRVLTVHVTSPRIAAKAGWRVGTTLDDVRGLGSCQCFPNGIACYAEGSLVIALVEDDHLCEDMLRENEAARQQTIRLERGDPEALATMRGHRIKELQWFSRSWKTKP